MTELLLDASGWKTKDDVYDSFFRVVGAPSWHGRNLDTPHDNIGSGQVNSVEVPCRLIVLNSQDIGAQAKSMLGDLVMLIHELAAEGCPVEIRVENTN